MSDINIVANIGEDALVSQEDLQLVAEEGYESMDWDAFYELLRKEREMGSVQCPQSVYLAWELLKPRIKRLPFTSNRTNNETIDDVLQQAYIVIAEKLPSYDMDQDCGFPTYIEKWLQGLARETRNDGLSDYQKKKFGIRLVSSDSLDEAHRNTYGEGSTDTIDNQNAMTNQEEISQHAPSVEEVYEKREKERSNRLLHGMVRVGKKAGGIDVASNLYLNVTAYAKLAGGNENFPDCMREDIEKMVADFDLD